MTTQPFPRIPKAVANGASLILAVTVLAAGLQWQKDLTSTKALDGKVSDALLTPQSSVTNDADKVADDASISENKPRVKLRVSDALPNKQTLDAIAKANTSIVAQFHQLNRTELVDTLVNAAKGGIKVEILLDKGSVNVAKESVDSLISAGATVVVDKGADMLIGNVIIIDGQRAITGSMWFGKPSVRVLEHIVAIDHPNSVKSLTEALTTRLRNGEVQQISDTPEKPAKPAKPVRPKHSKPAPDPDSLES